MRAVYPGTFDPFTGGHADILARARTVFERVTVLVAVNDGKAGAASPAARAAAIPDPDVEVWEGLVAHWCRANGVAVIVRGVRNERDLVDEQRLAAMNETLGVATLLLPARPALAAVSSSAVRGRWRRAGPGLPG